MDGRAYRRVSIDREIKCQIGNAATWVVLYDLSSGGAMIEGGHIKFVVGDEVQLHLHDSITVSGKVSWQTGGNAGVQFDGLLGDSIVEHLGFRVSALAFEEQMPRDRLGELLVKPPANSMPSVPPITLEPCDSSQDWRDAARLKEDRRHAERDKDRRREERLEIGALAKLCISARGGVEGRIIDLSTKGCSFLDPSESFQTGDEVWLKLEALEPWRGKVRWIKKAKVGIEFERPFYPAVLNHLVELHRVVVVSKAA